MIEASQVRRSVTNLSRDKIRAFTLIELMIVVVIMGILASLAVYGVSNYIQKSKTTEAREVVAQIMSAQEAYFDEVGSFLDVTGGVTSDASYYPSGTFSGHTRIQWGGSSSCKESTSNEDCVDRFRRLGVFVNQPVMFRYAATVMAAGTKPALPSSVTQSKFNPNNVVAPRPGYVVVAQSDLDDDGGTRTAVVGTSLQAQLYLENAGR